MNIFSDSDYDPGFLNTPGKGQSMANPLAPCFYYSMGVTTDATIQGNIYAGQTINAGLGFTWNYGKNFCGPNGFTFDTSGTFNRNVLIRGSLRVLGCIYGTGCLTLDGIEFRPTTLETISGPIKVLAAV